MKIEAIIRPEKVEPVRRALSRIGYPGMMVTEIEGHGQQKGLHSDWPPEMRIHFLPKSKLEIVLDNRHWKKVVKAIFTGSRTGEKGGGKIFISEIVDAFRIRTGETGLKAISYKPSGCGSASGKPKADPAPKKKSQLVKV